jgi:hypothetical protein
MNRKVKIAFALAIALAGPRWASAQLITTSPAPFTQTAPATAPASGAPKVTFGAPVLTVTPASQDAPVQVIPAPGAPAAPPQAAPAQPKRGGPAPAPAASPAPIIIESEAPPPADDAPLGPTPLLKVGILQGLIFGDDADKAKWKVAGWLDADATYRSTGHGINNIAPVMNRFGDEALLRQAGILISRPLDPTCWSWGFNAIFIAGADASFLGPTAGGWANTNPRFGAQFTDLNLTAHLPILTDGGVDLKVGRQTTVLGPMGALAWQRPLNSSDYAWYNLEEGRYTGISANWMISKQLSWYNGVEYGGWGVFFDGATRQWDYITQINYWLDCDAKTTKVWTTVLTGPTGRFQRNGNTTTFEAGILHNWNKYLYTILDTQMTYSKAPIFFNPGPGYQERAYDVYMYTGLHLNCKWDATVRLEWYRDVDGGGYPGGFGVPHTTYWAPTVGLNYHPTKWAEFRPEIRYDGASNPNFGANNNFKNQVTISADILLKF